VSGENVHRDSVEYWRTVTADDRPVDARHPSPKQSVLAKYLARLEPRPGQRILDVGIGFGRFVDHYLSLGLDVHGIDVDPKMIDALHASFAGRPVQARIELAEALTYPDEMFDLIVCWGVFDELDQGPSLAEMARVLKTGGQMLLTGKNSRYHADDTEANAAEIGARSKNHRNFFTDLGAVDFGGFGLELASLTTFARRGDFAAERPTAKADIQAPFYEYAIAARKVRTPDYDRHTAPAISRAVSQTFEARSTIT
jgi:SAM-dependent methyltransferase